MSKGDFVSAFAGGASFVILILVLAASIVSDDIAVGENMLWLSAMSLATVAFIAVPFTSKVIVESIFILAFSLFAIEAFIDQSWIWLALSSCLAAMSARSAVAAYKKERAL